jgi:predicted transposase YdaD
MALTDHPLKELLDSFALDFAGWLLEGEVQTAQPLNVELRPPETAAADQLFRVTLAGRRETLLHLEFQGPGSRRPMKWRMLDYMSRLAEAHRLDLCSVLFYVGGAGAKDTGEHRVNCPDGTASLLWRYRAIHLWRMKAEELLGLGKPGLLALIGQTQIDRPAELLPQVIERIKRVPDGETQDKLLTLLTALMSDKEIVEMAEKLIEREEWFMNTPFVHRLLERGRVEGREEGRQEGQLMTRRQDILKIVGMRFAPSLVAHQQMEQRLQQITDEAQLERLLFMAAIQAQSLADFQAVLEPLATSEQVQ